jgi:LacI family transcriptional regulator
MTDVAKQAGVSLTSVSHVLNKTREVSEQTRERVLAAAELLGFADERLTTAYSPQRTVGVIVPSVSSPYFGELIEGLSAEARRLDTALLLMTTSEDPELEFKAVQTLLGRRVDGIIMTPSRKWGEKTKAVLHGSGEPCVLVDRLEDPRFDQVGCESTTAAEAIVRHLMKHGHTRIGLIRGLEGLSTTIEREAGYRRAFEKHRIPIDERYIVDGLSTVKGGQLAAERLLTMPEPPTAIFVSNNNMTMGMLAAIRRLNARIPDDVAVVAFDDLEWSDLVQPGITSIAQPFHAMGGKALQMLLARLDNPQLTPTTMRLPASLEFRESCGCTAGNAVR